MWEKEQAKTVLILRLQDDALTMVEVLGGKMSYGHFIEAMEIPYRDCHSEHVCQAQLRTDVGAILSPCNSRP